MAKSNRNGAIDFFRFYFCIMIVLRHSAHALPSGFPEIMKGGALGVEFFFIVSGYLLACSAFKRVNNGNPIKVAADTNTFMKRKAGSLMPDLAVAAVISMTCYSITLIPKGFEAILNYFAAKIWNPLLLSASGIGVKDKLHYLFMTVNHGSNAANCTVNKMAEFFARKGVVTAYGLDGGQTSEIVWQGVPYNHVDWASERIVSDIIYFASAVGSTREGG